MCIQHAGMTDIFIGAHYASSPSQAHPEAGHLRLVIAIFIGIAATITIAIIIIVIIIVVSRPLVSNAIVGGILGTRDPPYNNAVRWYCGEVRTLPCPVW
jgi:hypothetical protein